MQQPAKSSRRIFLADDDPDDRLLFEEALREVDKDININVARDGVNLMKLLDKNQAKLPNIIFLDLNMPGKNGMECLVEIKNSKSFKDIPVIVFSTSNQKEAVNEVYEKGASYYVCKPNSFPKLVKSLKQIIAVDWSVFTGKVAMKDFLISF